jgi:hypothetical protein
MWAQGITELSIWIKHCWAALDHARAGNLRRMIVKHFHLKIFGSAILVMSEGQNVVLLVDPAEADK